MELSHRSSEFEAVLDQAERDLRELLRIPQDYKVLFMQGGATAQVSFYPVLIVSSWNKNWWSRTSIKKFSAIVYNFIRDLKAPVDYILSGAWSEKAFEEAKRLGANAQVVVSSSETNHDGTLLRQFL